MIGSLLPNFYANHWNAFIPFNEILFQVRSGVHDVLKIHFISLQENQVVVWRNSHNHSAASASMSLGTPDSTGSSSVESHSLSIESTTTTSGGLAIASDSSPLTIEQLLSATQQQPQQQQQQPYYLMTPPSSQWIPPVCPPPPPQQAYPAAQAGYLGPQPTPVYVTFSDGTTMIVPGHRLTDPQQPGPCNYSFESVFCYKSIKPCLLQGCFTTLLLLQLCR